MYVHKFKGPGFDNCHNMGEDTNIWQYLTYSDEDTGSYSGILNPEFLNQKIRIGEDLSNDNLTWSLASPDLEKRKNYEEVQKKREIYRSGI